jgi:hypothetical protein
MKNLLEVTVYDGKYTVIQDSSGKLFALRYGQPWRDCVGDGLICALAHEVEKLREDKEVFRKENYELKLKLSKIEYEVSDYLRYQ